MTEREPSTGPDDTVPTLVDPVMIAESGARLLEQSAEDAAEASADRAAETTFGLDRVTGAAPHDATPLDA